MKLKFLLLFSFFYGITSAQNNTYGVEIGSFSNIQQLDAVFPEWTENGNGYSFSIAGLRNESFSKKLDLTFGVGYKITRYHVRDYAILFGGTLNEIDWFEEYFEDRSKFHYAILSTEMKIVFFDSKTKFFIKPRIELNQFMGRSAVSFTKTRSDEYIDKGTAANRFILRNPNKTLALVGCGIGAEIPFENQNLFFEIRSSYAFGKLFKPLVEDSFPKTKINARIIPVGLVTGFNF